MIPKSKAIIMIFCQNHALFHLQLLTTFLTESVSQYTCHQGYPPRRVHKKTLYFIDFSEEMYKINPTASFHIKCDSEDAVQLRRQAVHKLPGCGKLELSALYRDDTSL